MKFKSNRFVRYVNEEQGCVFVFGKYKGLTLTEVLDEQEGQNYLRWMVDEVDMDSDLEKFLEETISILVDPLRIRPNVVASLKGPLDLGKLEREATEWYKRKALKEKKGGVR